MTSYNSGIVANAFSPCFVPFIKQLNGQFDRNAVNDVAISRQGPLIRIIPVS